MGDEVVMTDEALAQIPEPLREQWKKMQAALHDANKEAETRRKRLAELEEAETKRQRESLSEVERIKLEAKGHKERADELQTKLDKLDLDAAIAAEAAKLKFKNIRYANLADLSAVKKDDAGKYTGIKEALEALAASDPDIIQKTVREVPGTPVADDGRKAASEEIQIARAQWRAPN